MFKLSCFTDEISQDLGHALKVCREFGLDGIELRSAWGKGPHQNDAGDVARIQSLIEASRLDVACIASPRRACRQRRPGPSPLRSRHRLEGFPPPRPARARPDRWPKTPAGTRSVRQRAPARRNIDRRAGRAGWTAARRQA